MDAVASVRMKRAIGTGPHGLGDPGMLSSRSSAAYSFLWPLRLFIIYLGIMLIIRGVMAVISAFMVSAFIKDLKNDPLLK